MCSDGVRTGVTHNDGPLVPEDPFHPALSFSLTYSDPYAFHLQLRRANFPALYDCLLGVDWSVIGAADGVDGVRFSFLFLKENYIRRYRMCK